MRADHAKTKEDCMTRFFGHEQPIIHVFETGRYIEHGEKCEMSIFFNPTGPNFVSLTHIYIYIYLYINLRRSRDCLCVSVAATVWVRLSVCLCHRAASFTYFGEVLRCPHKRIVTIKKVYIARNNIHVELIRFHTN